MKLLARASAGTGLPVLSFVLAISLALAGCVSLTHASAVPGPPFGPWWVQNFAATHLWSGPDDRSTDYGVVPQWSYFLVVAPQTGPRLMVFVPWTHNYAFVDAKAVGPSGPPPSNGLLDPAFTGQRGRFGIAVRNLKTGETTLINADEFFPAASLYKLAVMAEVFRLRQVGQLRFDEDLTVQQNQADEGGDEDILAVGDKIKIQQALDLMIDQSNNIAAHALADRVGWEQINQTMGNLGLNYTRLPVGTWKARVNDWRSEESSTSPSDMLAFFLALYNHQLVSPNASDDMLKLLLNQRINDRLPAKLPPGTAVAHKTGNLANVVNDAGIVYGPTANFIIVILSHDVDEGLAASAEAQFSRRVYDRFNQPAGTP
jgi:beta-lactamase class A